MTVNASAGFPFPWSVGEMSSSMAFNGSSGGRSTGTAGIQMPEYPSFDSGETGCGGHNLPDDPQDNRRSAAGAPPPPKLHLSLRSVSSDGWSRKDSIIQSAGRDSSRVRSLHRRVTEKINRNALSRLRVNGRPGSSRRALKEDQLQQEQHLMVATLESGTSEGTGEYLMDVYLGSPPRHYSLILDTGSDLNWIQCLPCHDCFPQKGPHYDPSQSTSYRNLSCQDNRCRLVSSPDPPHPCRSPDQSCPYYYWYGDQSNTTGELALDVFTVNVTSGSSTQQQQQQHTLLFGCGHWNRGLFHGAAGLLGLGRGPLSFSSQLRKLYGHSFSYCFVDRDSDPSVTGRLLLGEDRKLMEHPHLNFTSFVGGDKAKDSGETETFYYVSIKGVMVGGKLVEGIPADAWERRSDGGGGTIIDSGTTLSYFVEPAYEKIKQAFAEAVGARYPRMVDFPIPLQPCYNVSSAQNPLQLPDLTIVFSDGALWHLPSKNCFVRLEDDLICLAMLSTPASSMSILGNYLQQNFHVLYDTKASRLGFAPRDCSRL